MASIGSKLPILIKGVVENAKPKLGTFLKYAKVELAPPKVSELPQVAAGIGKVIRGAKTGAWKNVTVREGWLNTLVALDIVFCFYIGECLGKGSLIGYQV